MRLALAPKVAVAKEDKDVAEEDTVAAREDKGVADEDNGSIGVVDRFKDLQKMNKPNQSHARAKVNPRHLD